MTPQDDTPKNLREIIPYVTRGDFETARKHLAIYRSEVEKRIRIFTGKSGSPAPESEDLNVINASLSDEQNTETTINALKKFDINFNTFIQGIPPHIYKKYWNE